MQILRSIFGTDVGLQNEQGNFYLLDSVVFLREGLCLAIYHSGQPAWI